MYFIVTSVSNVELEDVILYFIVKNVIVVYLKVFNNIINVCREGLIMIV